MPVMRLHYHCEACEGSWLAEGEAVLEADCPFCGTHDVFVYKTDEHVLEADDAATMARQLAAAMREAVAKPAPRAAERPRLKRTG